jgi:hypothetical protein
MYHYMLMSELTAEKLVDTLQSFDPYSAWVKANAEEYPVHAGPKAKSDFLVALAEAGDDLLPLPYQLGALAVFEQSTSPDTLVYETNWKADFSERKRPKIYTDPFFRIALLGDALNYVSSTLQQAEGNIPVVAVREVKLKNLTVCYEEVVEGRIEKPKSAFVLEHPRVVSGDSQPSVAYAIPDSLKEVELQIVHYPAYNGDVIKVQPGEVQIPSISSLVEWMTERPYFHRVAIGEEAVEVELNKPRPKRDDIKDMYEELDQYGRGNSPTEEIFIDAGNRYGIEHQI